MEKLEIKKTKLFEELETTKEKEDYIDSYLNTLCCFSYLNEYDNLNFHQMETLDDIKDLNIEPISKTFFSIIYFKSKIQNNNETSQGTLNGYYDVMYKYESTLKIIRNIMMYKDNYNKDVDFFK